MLWIHCLRIKAITQTNFSSFSLLPIDHEKRERMQQSQTQFHYHIVFSSTMTFLQKSWELRINHATISSTELSSPPLPDPNKAPARKLTGSSWSRGLARSGVDSNAAQAVQERRKWDLMKIENDTQTGLLVLGIPLDHFTNLEAQQLRHHNHAAVQMWSVPQGEQGTFPLQPYGMATVRCSANKETSASRKQRQNSGFASRWLSVPQNSAFASRWLSVPRTEAASFREDSFHVLIGPIVTAEEKPAGCSSDQESVAATMDTKWMRPVAGP